jgi:hypothetical protein
MHQPSVKHTIDIFRLLTREFPPFVPKELKQDIKQAYEQVQHNFDLSLEEVEHTVIVFGKKLWPYRKAFEEFFNIYESKFGEKFLIGALTPTLKKRYKEFKEYGGVYRDLHTGNPSVFFEATERHNICKAIISVNENIRLHTVQAIMTVDRIRYEKRVVEFQLILDDIEKRLDSLRLMADDEQEHPELATEIREQVKSFEHGICLLGPPHHYDAICRSEEHFVGRKKEKMHKVL